MQEMVTSTLPLIELMDTCTTTTTTTTNYYLKNNRQFYLKNY